MYMYEFIIRNWLSWHMEAKSHDLWSASWRPNSDDDVNSSLSPKAGKD